MSLLLIMMSSQPVVNDYAACSLKKHLMLKADAISKASADHNERITVSLHLCYYACDEVQEITFTFFLV